MPEFDSLLAGLDLQTGAISGRPLVTRCLSDLRGSFVDAAAYEAALAANNPPLYSVSSVDTFNGTGDLHYGLGVLRPGKVGAEYFLTKGHLHAWRPAAEVYIGLRGHGVMLLEPENSDQVCLVELGAACVVYVPGSTAHRTINTGSEPLVYLGVYPATAGHDYKSIAANNFRHVVIERDGRPALLPRSDYLKSIR